MAPLRVVVVLDVVADGVVRFGSRFESAAVHELFLEGREEALGDGVVVARERGVVSAGLQLASGRYVVPVRSRGGRSSRTAQMVSTTRAMSRSKYSG
jgi:hypothetical protein